MIINIVNESNLGLFHSRDVTFKELIITQLENDTCLANCINGIRSNATFQSIKFLQFDFDDVEYSPEQISNLIDCKHYILISKSDSIKARCYHLFVPLEEEITKYDYYGHICNQFLETYKLPIKKDERAKDAVRFFWRHKAISIIKLNKNFRFFSYSKKELIEKILLSRKIDIPSKTYSSNKSAKFAIECYCKKHNRTFDLKKDGGRWQSMIFIKNILQKMDFSIENIKEFIDSEAIYSIDKNSQFTKNKVHKFLETYT